MIVKFGTLIVGARGTVGGMILSANAFGPYARTWSKGANPRSDRQTAHRATITKFASNWRNLTQVLRDGWDTYAAAPAQDLTNSLSETYSASGFNWYVRINTHLTDAGLPARTAAPTLTRPVAPVVAILTLVADPPPSSTRVFFNAADPQKTMKHAVFFTMVNSQGKLVAPARMALLTVENIDMTNFIVIQDEVEDRFGLTSSGMRGFVSAQAQDAHGQRGPEATSFGDAA